MSPNALAAGSILETVSALTFGTNTVPSGATAAFSGLWPTLMVATTFRVLGSIRETVFEPLFETQTALAVTATERGFCPTRTLATRFVRASIRNTRRPKSEPTQTAPPPYRRLAGPEFGMWIRRPTL